MKRNLMRAGVIAGVLSLGLVSVAGAATLLNEHFWYPNGSLTDLAAWTDHSGTTGQTQVVSGKVVQLQGTQSEDVNTPLSAARSSSDVTWVCFKLEVSSAGSPSFGAGDYFAHFRFSGNFIYPGRIYIRAPQSGGDFNIGIRPTSGATVAEYWPSDQSFDTEYVIAVKFDAGSGDATLYVDPASEASPSVTSLNAGSASIGAEIDQYALRQGSGNTATYTIDDIVVAPTFTDAFEGDHVPSASTWSMILMASLMIGVGAMFVVRRRSSVVA